MTAGVTVVQRPIERIVIRKGSPVQVVPRPTPRVIVRQAGPAGRDGALSNYEHVQASPASAWIVNHNLGRKPAAVSVRSPGGIEVIAAILHVSVNQLQISFAAPATGSAFMQ